MTAKDLFSAGQLKKAIDAQLLDVRLDAAGCGEADFPF